MRLLTLELIAYGPFTGVTLDFSAPSGLHVVYGPNEAGKSTTLRAVTGLLYGIPKHTPDAHLHKMPDLRIGARLADARGAELRVVRRKGNVNTLLDPAGNPIDDGALKRALGGASQELFELMFGLNHDTLRQGAEALLHGRGNLGESLFGAGLGGGGLREILEELKKEADDLFTPQARTRPLNDALRALTEAQKKAKDLSLSSDAWIKQKQALEEAGEERRRIDEQARGLQAQQNRLRRGKRVLPLLAKRALLLERQAALGDVALLPSSAARDREEAQRQEQDAAAQGERLAAEIRELEARRGALSIPMTLIEQEDLALDAQERLGSYKKGQADLPRLRAELRLMQHEATTILRKVGRDVPLEKVEALRVDAAAQARIKKLALRPAALEEKLRSARSAQEDAAGKLAEHRARLAEVPEGGDSTELRRAIARAQRQGDLEPRLQKAASDAQRLEETASARLAALGLFTGELSALKALPVPPPESVDRAAEDWAAIEKQRERLAEGAEALEQRRIDLDRGIDELQRGGAVPTEEELERARARRDEAWVRVRQGLEASGAKAGAKNAALAEAYEPLVRSADEIGDRLRREAARVAKLAALLADRGATKKRIEASLAEAAQVERRFEEAAERFRALFRSCGIEPRHPAEMRGWLARQAALVALSEQLSATLLERDTLRQKLADHRRELAAALEAAGEDARGEGELGALMAQAERAAGGIERVIQRRREIEHAIAGLEKEQERLRREREDGEAELAAWRAAWGKAVVTLGLGEEASAEEATAILDELNELFRKIDEVKKTQRRVEALERDAEQFEADVEGIVRNHAPDLEGQPADQAAAHIVKRYQQGREDLSELNQIDRELRSRRAKLEEQRQRRASAEARLAALMQQARAESLAELEEAERRSQEAQSITQRLLEVEEQLLQIGEGAGLPELYRETSGIDADSLAAELDEVDAKLAELENRRRQTDTRIGGIQAGLDHLSGASLAAEAAAEAQECLARVRGYAERYVRAKLAALVLGREIERYRERNQGPILTRSSDLFRRLTLGAFTSLRPAFDEKDEAVLRCVRKSGQEAAIEALSDGTRDQLFLSLRLATLERYAETNEPMPLIVDDILVHFDDERSRATLEVLGEVSEQTQILFFTHHARLVELARKAVPPEKLMEHRLG